jgi:hypothetical protein
MTAAPVAYPSAYLIRLKVSEPHQAAALAEALAEHGASVEREGRVVTTIWPASDADHVHLWGEHDFPELVFFLRAWAGGNADRQVVVLEERPLVA